jgi:hypothetical protein
LLPCALENGKNFYLCCKSNYLVIFDWKPPEIF